MIKIFLSQPMTGYSDDEIQEERDKMIQGIERTVANFDKLEDPMLKERVQKYLMSDDTYEFLDQVALNRKLFRENPYTTAMDYLRADLALLGQEAVFAIFHPKYRYSKGCLVELQVCKSYKIPFLIMDSKYGLKFYQSKPKKTIPKKTPKNKNDR